jgi:hypothetical protein
VRVESADDAVGVVCEVWRKFGGGLGRVGCDSTGLGGVEGVAVEACQLSVSLGYQRRGHVDLPSASACFICNAVMLVTCFSNPPKKIC